MIKAWYLVITAFCLLIASCAMKEEVKKEKAKKQIPVIQLAAKDTFLQKRYVASIQAIRNVDLRNKVAGYLEKIYVDEGNWVKKGQLLFSINPIEFNAEVSKAEAVLSNAVAEAKEAEVQLGRVKLLVNKKVISPTELDVAEAKQRSKQAKINEAKSTLSNAQAHLSYTFIRAPFDGIIDRIPFKMGSLLTEGSLLTSVSDIKSVYAYFNISEDEYLKYLRDKGANNSSANTVFLNLADGTRYKHSGEIQTTSSEFEGGTGSIAFRAMFPNPDKMLRHGASGEIIVNTKAEDVLMVPQKSVFEIQDKDYVFVVDKNNTITMKSFLPQTRISDFYIVNSGLEAGEKIVYEGTQNLKNGMKIIPRLVNLNDGFKK